MQIASRENANLVNILMKSSADACKVFDVYWYLTTEMQALLMLFLYIDVVAVVSLFFLIGYPLFKFDRQEQKDMRRRISFGTNYTVELNSKIFL